MCAYFASRCSFPTSNRRCICAAGNVVETLEDRRLLSTSLTLVRQLAPTGVLGNFGSSVALDGRRAVVSSCRIHADYFEDWSIGSAHLFDTSTGKQLGKLESSNGTGNRYGHAVALNGNRAMVASGGGIYGFDTASCKQVLNLSSKEEQQEYFGSSVAIDGNTILQGGGTSMIFGDLPQPPGSARLFDAATGKQIANLTPDGLAENFGFGCSVDISGNYALVGSNGNGAYLFDVGSRKLLRKFEAASDDQRWFGTEVAIDGKLALITGSGQDQQAQFCEGVFVYDLTNGKQVAKLSPVPDVYDYRASLGSVALSGNYAMVGLGGTVYVFNATSGRQIASLHSTSSFAIDGNLILAAGNGSAYLYTISEGGSSSITGRVFNDDDEDGKKDSGEIGLSGRTVFADLDNDKLKDASEPSAITNSGGMYTIKNLAAGSYNVRQVLPVGWTQSTPGNNYGFKVSLAAGQDFTGALHGSHLNLGSISGRVFNDLDHDGRMDAGELGLKGRTLFLDLDDDSVRDADEPWAITNSNGWYTIKKLPAGYYNVRQILPAGWKQSIPKNGYGWKVQLSPGQNTYSGVHGAFYAGPAAVRA